MKILITGFTGIQAHASSGQLDIISNIASIVGALEDSDHEVEWRAVTPGEDISSFDRCIVAVNGVASWTSPFALGGLYVIGERPDAILTYDDWQGPNAFSSGNPEKELAVVWNPKLNRLNHEEAYADEDIKATIDSAVNELCFIHQRKVLIPSFAHGNLVSLNLGAPNAVKYDPSSYMIDRYDYNKDADKARIWVSAALAFKESWFKHHRFGWEVEYYGVRKLGQRRVREAELANIYSERWGVISPPHPHAGSGWFRVRFLMAALAGAIVYCDPRESFSITGEEDNTYDYSIIYIEESTDEELKSLADNQRQVFFSKIWSKQQLQQFLNTVLET